MTISGVSQFSHAGASLDASSQLAVLVLEQQEQQQDSDRQDMSLARASYIAESNAQVEAMHDQADATRLGAFVQAGFSGASAAIQLDLCLAPPESQKTETLMKIGAGVLNEMSALAGKYVGDAAATDAQAVAKHHESLAKQAEWDLSDAKSAIDRSDKRQDQALQWLATEASAKAEASSSIIAGLA